MPVAELGNTTRDRGFPLHPTLNPLDPSASCLGNERPLLLDIKENGQIKTGEMIRLGSNLF
jgi:hypothetical protein